MYNFAPHELAAIEQMEKMDPQQQQQYVNNKVGQMPIYQLMALQNEVKRRQMIQAALPQQQPPQSTVAQDLQQQLGQGIASQPVHNVGNPQSYNCGGIVTFDDGGEVQHFANTGAVNLYDRRIQPEPAPEIPTWSAEDEAQYQEELALQSQGYMNPQIVGNTPMYTPKAIREKQKEHEGVFSSLAERRTAYKKYKATPAAATAKPGEQPAVAADYEGLARLIGKQRPDDGAGGRFSVNMPSFGAPPKMELPSKDYITDKRRQLAEEEAKLGTDKTAYIEKEMADREALENKLGIGKANEKRAELLTKREKEIPSSEKGMWQAISRAGFAFAGSKNLAEGIKNGSEEGFNFYTKFQDHRRDLQDKLDTARFQLEASQEAVKAGRLSAADASYKEQKAAVRATQDQIAAAELADRKLFYTEAGENFRAELARRTQVAVSAMNASASAKDRAVLERMIKLTSVMNDKRNPIGVRTAAQEELQNYTSAIGAMDLAQNQGELARARELAQAQAGMYNPMGGNMPGWDIKKN